MLSYHKSAVQLAFAALRLAHGPSALWKTSNKKLLLCEHNAAFCWMFSALLFAFVNIIPQDVGFVYKTILKFHTVPLGSLLFTGNFSKLMKRFNFLTLFHRSVLSLPAGISSGNRFPERASSEPPLYSYEAKVSKLRNRETQPGKRGEKPSEMVCEF